MQLNGLFRSTSTRLPGVITIRSEKKPSRGIVSAILIVIAAGAVIAGAWLRLDRLELRPMHLDEAVQAIKFRDLLENGDYVYDPSDYHGPVLLYSTLPVAWIAGAGGIAEVSERMLRCIPAFYGIALLLLLLPLRRAMPAAGWLATLWLAALSPLLVFYSRYYIMEVPMVFFVTAGMLCAWRYLAKPGWTWAILFGVCGGIVHATKETGAISYLGFLVAGIATWAMTRSDSGRRFPLPPGCRWIHPGASLVAGLAVSALLFTAGWTQPQGAIDSVLTYFHYADRAGNTEHNKPWFYYLKTLFHNRVDGGPIWSEALILLPGIAGILLTLTSAMKKLGNPLVFRFLALYTLFMGTIYAIIPYKTPWSMLPWAFTLIPLAGLFFGALLQPGRRLRRLPIACAGAILLISGLLNLLRQDRNSLFRFYADDRNPFVYGHTTVSLTKLVQRIEDLRRLSEAGYEMPVQICNEDWGWPLPWYLRSYTKAGYWPDVPEPLPPGDVVVVSLPMRDAAASQLESTHTEDDFYGLRDDILLTVFVKNELWDKFIDERSASPAP